MMQSPHSYNKTDVGQIISLNITYGHPHINILQTPPWMSIIAKSNDSCLIKTFLRENLGEKTKVKEKEYNIILDH